MRRRFGRKAKKPPIMFLAVLLIIITYLYYITDRNIKPTLLAMSEIKARLLATQAVNDAVTKKMLTNNFNNLIIVKTDNNGKVTFVQANTMEMNRLAAMTAIAIQNEIKNIAEEKIGIPISNIFGSQIFANMGPRINIHIQPAGSVFVDFNTEFEAAGINQTRLKIYLISKTNIQIVIPLVSKKIEVVTHIPVAETIIVGDVPDSYILSPPQDIPNYVPTKDPFSKN